MSVNVVFADVGAVDYFRNIYIRHPESTLAPRGTSTFLTSTGTFCIFKGFE